jgi:hypothetical protein
MNKSNNKSGDSESVAIDYILRIVLLLSYFFILCSIKSRLIFKKGLFNQSC